MHTNLPMISVQFDPINSYPVSQVLHVETLSDAHMFQFSNSQSRTYSQ